MNINDSDGAVSINFPFYYYVLLTFYAEVVPPPNTIHEE